MSDKNDPADSDDLILVDDDSSAEKKASANVWSVLVVDDDEDVHETTRFALRNATILDRPIQLIHARSAAEARKTIDGRGDIAVALIDVVMETPDAGLRLVRDLRSAGFSEMRIVLRTGQPGYAPELSVIAEYEIDDYRTKSELTQTRLLTVLTATIRAYQQIRTITRSRTGLEMIVESSSKLFQRTNLELFSRGVLTQIAGLLSVAPNGIVCVSTADKGTKDRHQIVSAAGSFAEYVGKPLGAIDNPVIHELLDAARGQPDPVTKNGYMALSFNCEAGRELLLFIEADCEVSAPDLSLLKLFSTNIAIGFENLALVERLDRLAYLDPVLDVPNLNAFEVALRARLATGAKDGRMALVSADSFPSVVAEYGPRIAHRFLGKVYEMLANSSGTQDVARVGDDTFAILGDRNAFDAHAVPAAVARPFRIHGIDIATTATAAVIDLADLKPDISIIMRLSNSALMHVKRTQPGKSVMYDASLRNDVERRSTLQAALKRAVKNGDGFAVHMQPKVDLGSREIIGAEALLRWKHKDENVSPAEFIPIAESVGLTEELTEFVIQTVGRWTNGRNGAKPCPVAVNLSMLDLNTPGFAERLLAQVAAAGLSAETVDFEVTEGIAMQDAPWAIEQVQALKDAGFGISLDDFGTGYSSLGHFHRLPIDTLKIDRSFVTPLDVRTARASLAAVILSMTEALNVDCVAEGIETAEQEQALAFLGCRVGQGYLFGKPVDIAAFDEEFMRPSAG